MRLDGVTRKGRSIIADPIIAFFTEHGVVLRSSFLAPPPDCCLLLLPRRLRLSTGTAARSLLCLGNALGGLGSIPAGSLSVASLFPPCETRSRLRGITFCDRSAFRYAVLHVCLRCSFVGREGRRVWVAVL